MPLGFWVGLDTGTDEGNGDVDGLELSVGVKLTAVTGDAVGNFGSPKYQTRNCNIPCL